MTLYRMLMRGWPQRLAVAVAMASFRLTKLGFRRHVHAASIVYIGKESNRLDDVEDELVHNWDEVRQVYVDSRSDPWHTCVLPILRLMPRSQLAQMTRITERHVRRLRNGHQQPYQETDGR